MASPDHTLKNARSDVSTWNIDRKWGYRGRKGYGIARNIYHRAVRRQSKQMCWVEVEDISEAVVTGESYVHGISDPMAW
jgi:hypothetical protein